MTAKFEYPIDDNFTNFFFVEADVIEDVSCGSRDLDVDFIAVALNGVMGIRLNEIPAQQKIDLEEKAKNVWNKEMQKSSLLLTEHLPQLAENEA